MSRRGRFIAIRAVVFLFFAAVGALTLVELGVHQNDMTVVRHENVSRQRHENVSGSRQCEAHDLARTIPLSAAGPAPPRRATLTARSAPGKRCGGHDASASSSWARCPGSAGHPSASSGTYL